MRKFSEQYASRCVALPSRSALRRAALWRRRPPPPPPGAALSLPLFLHASKPRSSGTLFCVDKSVTAVVIKGLAEHKDEFGAPLCPCRHYDDKPKEIEQGFWNCPCVPMRERKECHCMLFLTPDNDFAGEDATLSLAELEEMTAGM
jgi:ferredoxin-thioredoxin reductase catalytic chain